MMPEPNPPHFLRAKAAISCLARWACWAAISAALGCAATPPLGRSPLLPPRMNGDSVALDVSFVRFPLADEQQTAELWSAVDEQILGGTQRQALARQGMRVGVISGELPSSLHQLLTEQPHESSGLETTLVEFDHDAKVVTKHVQSRAGRRIELVASENYPLLCLLESQADGRLTGRQYERAECRLNVVPRPTTDGAVALQVTPELQYGDPKPLLAQKPEMGLMMFETARPRRVFTELDLTTRLAPGETLVFGADPAALGSLGHHFFTTRRDADSPIEQKLLLVRVVQTQHAAGFGDAVDSSGLDASRLGASSLLD